MSCEVLGCKASRAKNEERRDLLLRIDTTLTKTIERVCVSPASKDHICLLCAKVITNKDFKRKLTISVGQKKTKA